MSTQQRSVTRAGSDSPSREVSEDYLDTESASADTATAPVGRTQRKTPFRGFTTDSKYSKMLLKAMLLKPPFAKSEGNDSERWIKVIQILQEGTAQSATMMGTGTDDNVYMNVEPRTCKLAWARFKEELKEHDKLKKTGVVADETPWLSLIRSVVEKEEIEEERRKNAAKSTKRSAELMEQNNRDGVNLRDAAMMAGPRRRKTGSDSDSAAPSDRTHDRKRRQDQRRQLMEEFIQSTQLQIAESSKVYEDRHTAMMESQTNLMTAMNNSSAQLQQLVTIQLQNQEALRIDRANAAEDRQRQTAVIEVLLNLLSKRMDDSPAP
ncbi:hypothetical protein BGX34_005808 [Mortierella sp. NVP85]|nr:hypothetical protein BGX34_005808 [Mortierella sp. NVP85]